MASCGGAADEQPLLGESRGGGGVGGEKLAVDSFADNIAAQMDPIRRAELYLRPWPYLAGRIWGGLRPNRGAVLAAQHRSPMGFAPPGTARPGPSHRTLLSASFFPSPWS